MRPCGPRRAGRCGRLHAGIKSIEAKALREPNLRPLWLVDLSEHSVLAGAEARIRAHNAELYNNLRKDPRTAGALADPDHWEAFLHRVDPGPVENPAVDAHPSCATPPSSAASSRGNPPPGRVLTMSTARLRTLAPEPTPGDAGPTWLDSALEHFRGELLQPAYPCNFGRRALLNDELYMTWVAPGEPAGLPGEVARFTELSENEHDGRAPLAIFVEPPAGPPTEAEVDATFWSLLQYLHDQDDGPWPEDVPTDPDEEGWQFSFHGVPMFVFALTPTNRLRRSRHAAHCLGHHAAAEERLPGHRGRHPHRDAARIGIRKRLADLDPIEFHPSMGVYGVMSEEEWKQYLIPDDSSDLHATCPLQHHRERVGAGQA